MGAVPAWATLRSPCLPPTKPGCRLRRRIPRPRRAARRAARRRRHHAGTAQRHRAGPRLVEPGRALRRDGAHPGDLVYVTGRWATPGSRCWPAGLFVGLGAVAALRERLDRPTPRLAEGRRWSHGQRRDRRVRRLAADLGHVCSASGVGATLYSTGSPARHRAPLRRETGDWSVPLAAATTTSCASPCPPAARPRSRRWPPGCRGAPLGRRHRAHARIRLVLPDGSMLDHAPRGYDHFAGNG